MLGIPDSIKEPKYECGFHSEEEQGKKFYQYYYGSMNFILSDSEADIEKIFFDDSQELLLNEFPINNKTEFDEIVKQLNIKVSIRSDKTLLTFYPKGGYDEHYYLKFENEKLIIFEIWTPC